MANEKRVKRLFQHAEALLDNIEDTVCEELKSLGEMEEDITDLKRLIQKEDELSRERVSKRADEISSIFDSLDESDESLVNEAIKLAQRMGEEYKGELAERLKKEGKIIISISDDKLRAYMTIIPPLLGAKEITYQDVIHQLKKHGVTYGIIDEAIYDTLDEVKKTREVKRDVVVACGIPAIQGKNTKIDFKVDLQRKRFKVREDGSIDFHEFGLITSIGKGEVIAIVHPATQGITGKTVTGEEIPSKPGKETKIVAGRNVEATDGGRVMVSKTEGQVTFVDGVLQVTPVCLIDGNVDLSTGNINFVGNVIIKGRVEDGFEVKAEGDITVHDNVGAAKIIAKGNIIVKNGIVGKGKGLVRTDGIVSAKFAENATIEAQGDVIIHNAIIHSDISTNGRIIANEKRGAILGGCSRAGRGIDAKVIGSDFGTPTEVMVGLNFITLKDLGKIEKTISFYEENLEKVEQTIDAFLEQEKELGGLSETERKTLAKTIRTKTAIREKLEKLKVERMKLLVKVRDKKLRGSVMASQTIYPGVKITTKNLKTEIKNDLHYVCIFENEKEGKIEITPYA